MAQDGLGETIRWCLGALYANDGMIRSQDVDWLQHTINVLVGFFRRYGLAANVSKSYRMTCQPGALRFVICGGQGAEVQRGGRFVPGETPQQDPLPGM